MRKSLLFFVGLFFITVPVSIAQEAASITTPSLELKDNKIIITYDILNSTRRDLFDIWIEITDTAGNKIQAHALAGDIGDEVKGGSHRVISWDLTADKVYLDAGIYVQVYGERLTPTVLDVSQRTDIQTNIYKSMGQSILFPGLGLAKLGKPNLHLVKGVFAYGSIAAAISLNRIGLANYIEYDENPNLTEDEYENLITKAQSQKKWSTAFGYTAVAVWVADLAWTYLSTSKVIKAQKAGQSGQVRMHLDYDPMTQAPVFGLRYTF